MKKTETDNPQGEPRDGQLKPVATPPVDNLTPAQRSLHQKFLQSVHSLRVGIVNTVYYLAAIHKHGIHRLLGHRRISDYAARYAGLSARQTKDFLHLARKLPDLPRIAEALDRGDLSWSQARELCGHVSVAKQTHWVELARALSRADLRELRRQETAGITRQSGCAVGSGQDEPVGPTRQIVQSPSGRAGSTSVETDRRQASGRRPQPSGPPPQHRALVTDERLRELKSAATNEKPHYVPLRFDAEQLARWDALLEFHQRREPGRSRAEIVLERLANHDRAPGTTPGRDVIAANHPPFLVVLLRCPECDGTNIVTSRGEPPAPAPLIEAAKCDATVEDSMGRRRRKIPPRLRRVALQRARYRCEATGCRHTRFLEVHHRQTVAGGGDDLVENLVVLCSSCHRRLHESEEQMVAVVQREPNA